MRHQSSNHIISPLKATITVLFSILACFFFIELILRIIFSIKNDYQIEMSKYSGTMKNELTYSGIKTHAHIPNISKKLMGINITTNSFGFRDKEYKLKKPKKTYRIMMLGDSLTLGWGVKNKYIFPTLLEKKLNNSIINKSIEVINTGVGNYNTEQEVAFFIEKGWKWKPDLLILNFFINDAELTPTKNWPSYISNSYLFMWAWGRFDIIKRKFAGHDNYLYYYKKLYSKSELGYQNMHKSFTNLIKETKKRNIKLLIVLLPELHSVGKNYFFKEIHNQINKIVKTAKIKNIVDLTYNFRNENPEKLWVSLDDAHPNKYAHNIISNGIFNYLLHNNIICTKCLKANK